MESLQNVLELIRDTFYAVPVHKNHQANLTLFVEEYLKFVCMPKGYGQTMRIFIKISKIQFSILLLYDDSYLQGDDYEDCFSSVLNTTEIVRSLEFTIHNS